MSDLLRCNEEVVLSPVDNNGGGGGRGGFVGEIPRRRPAVNLQVPLLVKSYRDPVLLEDERVFNNMMSIEKLYISAKSDYFSEQQDEIKPHMRKIVADWMLEVCVDQNCHLEVFLLGCNIMDRFLSQTKIKKSQFQLVAAATIFIASKLIDTCPIAGYDLVRYTDDTYTVTELLETELVILSKLKWDLSAVTSYNYLDYLMRLLFTSRPALILPMDLHLRNQTEKFIVFCATDFRFSMYAPSMLSSAALAVAAYMLANSEKEKKHSAAKENQNRKAARSARQFDINLLINRLQEIININDDDDVSGVDIKKRLQNCIQEIQDAFAASRAVGDNHHLTTPVCPPIEIQLAAGSSSSAAGHAVKPPQSTSNGGGNERKRRSAGSGIGDIMNGGDSSSDSDDDDDEDGQRTSRTPTEPSAKKARRKKRLLL